VPITGVAWAVAKSWNDPLPAAAHSQG